MVEELERNVEELERNVEELERNVEDLEFTARISSKKPPKPSQNSVCVEEKEFKTPNC